MTESEMIMKLETIVEDFTTVINEIKKNHMQVGTDVLNLIDKINNLSVEV